MKRIESYGDVLQIRTPLPFPLAWVNSYLVRGRDGYTLIDPGIHTDRACGVWMEVLEESGISADSISKIILTHHHPDHYGLSGWFQRQSGAPVYLSPEGIAQVNALWGPERTLTRELTELFREHGMDEETLGDMTAHMESFVALVSPRPELTPLPRDMDVRIGDRICRILHTPGHALGHYCFVDEERKEIFCGDQVLPQITPNVSVLPGFDDDPLQSFLVSLKDLRRLEMNRAYPGHRNPFAGIAGRAEEIIRHHDERLDRICSLLDKPDTAFGVCRKLFGSRLSTHQLRFAMAETLAHLVYLERRGAVERLGKSSPADTVTCFSNL